MEAAVPALGEAVRVALELAEEPCHGHTARGESSEVAVHWQDVLVRLHGQGGAHGHCLLPDPAEPLADTPLPEHAQHLLLNEARAQQALINVQQFSVVELLPVEGELLLLNGIEEHGGMPGFYGRRQR